MSYVVRFDEAALKELSRLPAVERGPIAAAVDRLAANPRPARAKRLSGNLKGLHRIRVGDYRVTYRIDAENSVVKVWEIGHRSKTYKNVERRGL